MWFLLHHPRIRRMVELANTRVRTQRPSTLKMFRRLSDMPRMSSLPIGFLLNEAVADMSVECVYVTVGVWHGFTYLAGMVGNPHRICIGIDDFSQFTDPERFGSPRQEFLRRFEKLRSPLHHFYEMDYRQYFREKHRSPIGVYFYDGDHSYAHTSQALELADPFIVPGGMMVIDDTNYTEPHDAVSDFLRLRSGRYDLLCDMRTAHGGHPTWWNGIMILRRR